MQLFAYLDVMSMYPQTRQLAHRDSPVSSQPVFAMMLNVCKVSIRKVDQAADVPVALEVFMKGPTFRVVHEHVEPVIVFE